MGARLWVRQLNRLIFRPLTVSLGNKPDPVLTGAGFRAHDSTGW
jgi:hypothetical protein